MDAPVKERKNEYRIVIDLKKEKLKLVLQNYRKSHFNLLTAK